MKSKKKNAMAKFEMKYLAKTKADQKFTGILLDSIDDAFASLGANVQLSLYFHLETKFTLSKQDIPDRIDDFSDALDRIFGQAARQVELLIIKCLNQRVKRSYKWVGPKWLVPDITFEKYVKLARSSVENETKTMNLEALMDDGEKPEQET